MDHWSSSLDVGRLLNRGRHDGLLHGRSVHILLHLGVVHNG
uniref:Uncharacterized protein n=1 Tax=Anopheles christyi TaxID=43041 RepID=A0A182KIX7_9DIPT